jgi:hypothetical protein
VEDLVGWVSEGRIRIPEFQRPIRWRAEHVSSLFDSLWLGYPVGSLLLWQRSAPAELVRLGPLQLPAEARADALAVVDGQQRLTSLASVLLHPNPTTSNGDLFALWFDLEEQRFVRARPGQDVPIFWLPMNSVLDAVRLGEWWVEHPMRAERPELYRVALQVGRRIRESKLPIYIVETSDTNTLRIIFARMNTAGIQMRETEVFNALHVREGGKEPLTVLGDVCAEAGMGRLEDSWALRCLRAVAGEPLDKPPRGEIEGYRRSLDPASAALALAVDFLRDACHVPHLRVLPYRLPLVTLTRFFHLHPQPSKRSRELLVRWFWRGVVTARHKDTGNPALRFITRAVDAAESASVQRLLRDVGEVLPESVVQLAGRVAHTEKGFNAAEQKLHALLLAYFPPRDLITGEPLATSELFEQLGPAALLPLGEGREDVILHPYLEDVQTNLDQAHPAVQGSHAWGAGWTEHTRRAELARRFAEQLTAWCGPGLPDLPPLADLFADLGEE